MSTLADVCEGLRLLAESLTGLDAVWENQVRPETRDTTRGIVLLSFGESLGVGRDELRSSYSDTTTDFGDTAVGQRSIPWRIKVESLEQGNADIAWNILEKMRTRMRWQGTVDALNALDISIASTGQTLDLQTPVDDHIVSRAALDIKLNVKLTEADPNRYPYVAEVQGTSQLNPGPEVPFDIVIP